MQRTGRRQELLQGPLLYALVHVVGALVFWRTSPVAVAALAVLCAGDGAAELFGVAFGRARCSTSELAIRMLLAVSLGLHSPHA